MEHNVDYIEVIKIVNQIVLQNVCIMKTIIELGWNKQYLFQV